MVSDNMLVNAQTFIHLLDRDKNYSAASVYLANDFAFQSPKFNAKSKADWLSGFPEFHKDAPSFEDAVLSDDGKTVIRKGFKKIGFLCINLMEIYEFDSEGKIKTITAKRL